MYMKGRGGGVCSCDGFVDGVRRKVSTAHFAPLLFGRGKDVTPYIYSLEEGR